MPEFSQVWNHKIISSTVWRDESGHHVERYQVITFREGKIVDMQGCSTRRDAERSARHL